MKKLQIMPEFKIEVRRWSADKVIIQISDEGKLRVRQILTDLPERELPLGTHLVPVKELPLWIGIDSSLDDKIAEILSGNKERLQSGISI